MIVFASVMAYANNMKRGVQHLPNILTLLRIAATCLFAVFFTRGRFNACIAAFAFSALSDVLDGFIARRFNLVSDLGKLLDPLADKISLIVISICFCRAGWIPGYMLAAIAVKEGCMLLGAILMLRSNVVAQADRFGKAASTIFNISIAAALLRQYTPFAFLGNLHLYLFGLSILCSFTALVHYARTQFADRIRPKG